MATVSINGGREVFLELQEKALRVLRERGQQGSSHSRALQNAKFITIRREGRRFVLSWFNAKVEPTSRSYLHFRWNDRLSKWIRDHIMFPDRRKKRRKFADRRRRRAEKFAKQREGLRLDLGRLAQEVCSQNKPPRLAS